MKINKKLALSFFILIAALTIKLYQDYHNGFIKLPYFIYQTKFNSIPKNELQVFVINLDRSTDRLEKVKKELEENKIEYKRFSAVDGYELQITDIKTKDTFSGRDLKDKKRTIIPGETYSMICPSDPVIINTGTVWPGGSAGEFGCYCSHRGVWKEMVQNNIQYALILEDDVTFPQDFNERFDKLINNLPNDWDVVYLHILTEPTKKLLSIQNNPSIKTVEADGSTVGSNAGYLITLKAAKELLESTKVLSVPIDWGISEAINSKRLKAYRTQANLLLPPEGDERLKNSTIYDMSK